MRTTLLLLGFLSACTSDGNVDWAKVGDGVALTGAVLIGAAAIAAASQPSPIVTTCNSFGWSTTCVTQ